MLFPYHETRRPNSASVTQMRPGQAVALTWAAASLGLTIWREIVWGRRFRSWKRAEGVVQGFNSEGDGPSLPIIGFSAEGRDRTFVSSYCLANPSIGESLTVLFDPDSERAVILTRRHRWFSTGLGGTCFLAFLGLAALSH